MNNKNKVLFSNFSFQNWRNLILAGIIFFYLIFSINYLRQGAVGYDFVAYWSVGRISDEKGFSQIYEIDNLKGFYSNELREQGLLIDIDNITYSVPYLPIFVLPFQLLSRIALLYSFWIWNFLNLVILFGYLIFFLQRIKFGNETSINSLYLLVIVFISYPVYMNFTSGNVNVFLLLCTGEFLRNAINKNPFISGMWLGGLLLKPPLLILIIPIIFITRRWKVLIGFFISSGLILLASIFLAGFSGMKSLINLWIGYPSDTFSNTAPEIMINWRMVGFILDKHFNLSIGWGIMGLGIVLTLFALYFHKNNLSHFGSSSWVLAMMGVFSASLAVTWHSHFYMAMVLIPFFIYASVHKLFPEKIIFLWGIVSPVVYFGLLIVGLFDYLIFKIGVFEFAFMVISFSGFVMNLIILYFTTQFRHDYV